LARSDGATRGVRKGCLLQLVVLLAIPVLLWKVYAYSWRLSHAPAGLGIWLILSADEESWGFGPGGNETGLIVYKLSETAAERVAAGGVSYLAELGGRYSGWKTTPIEHDRRWLPHPEWRKPVPDRASIVHFLDQYGFGIKVDQQVSAMIDAALSSHGSYYAYGRTGLVIVIPNTQRAIYAYAG